MNTVQTVDINELDHVDAGYFAVVFGNSVQFNGKNKDNVKKMFERCQGGNKRIYAMPSVENLHDLYYILKKSS